MTDQTKINRFHKGLKEGVRNLLVGKPKPTKFDDYVKLCIELDNAYHEHELELKASKKSSTTKSSSLSYHTPRPNYAPSPSAPASTPSALASSDVVPMEIDALKRGPLTQEEKDRRKRLGLCHYCGQGKHMVDNCPNMSAKAKAARANAKASPSSGKA